MIDGGLRKIFRDHLPEVHWTSIETGGTGRGIPDSNGCCRGHEFWVEYKLTDGWTAGLRPEQVAWISRRVRAGGRVLVAVRRRTTPGPRRGPAVDELWLFRGEDVMLLAKYGLRAGPEPLIRCEGGPSQWLWPVVLEHLLGGPLEGRAGGRLVG